ncbi:MOSC domain-containing protein [Thalassiella azotivora]
MGRVLAVCRVAELHLDESPHGVTAIDKRPVEGRVPVRRLGVRGDVQADRADHGGPDQAVYAFDDAEAAYWAAEIGRDVVPGLFGENLRTRDVAVDDAEIGERWLVGDGLLLEVTAPRVPCSTFARWLGEERWVRRFADHGRTGAYLRVVEAGDVGAGDRVQVVSRPGHGVTVSGWFVRRDPRDARALVDYEQSSGWSVPRPLRNGIERALTRA